jgi:TetR/AcrR family transcriptional regulator
MTAGSVSTPAKGRQRVNRGSEAIRSRLVESALSEFAARGFGGASTRSIASRAQAHQPQINYHFESKDELWRACLELLLAELDAAITERTQNVDSDDQMGTFEAIIRGLVTFASRRPELNRIMMHEGTEPSERLSWLVTTHLQWRFDDLRIRWEELTATATVAPLRGELLYHVLLGAACLLYANAPEASLLGLQPNDDSAVAAHADSLVAMFLGTSGP